MTVGRAREAIGGARRWKCWRFYPPPPFTRLGHRAAEENRLRRPRSKLRIDRSFVGHFVEGEPRYDDHDPGPRPAPARRGRM